MRAVRLSTVVLGAALLAQGVGGAVAWGDGGAVTAEARPADAAPVAYHEDVAFHLFLPAGARTAQQRARDASRALAAALDAPVSAEPAAPDADVAVTEAGGQVRVRGYLVTAVSVEDALAAGFPDLQTYAEHLETRLTDYVPAQLRRESLQQTALHLFVTVFLGLLTLLALKQVARALARADSVLEARRGVIGALSVFGVPVMGGEAVGGLLALLLAVGRWLAYGATLVTGLAAMMSQFPQSRRWMELGAGALLDAVLKGAQAVVGAVPSVLLALLLLLLLQAALRVTHVLLDEVQQGRVPWSGVSADRAPLVRTLLRVALILVVVPLVVAAAFGRFGTPLETLALWSGGAVLLAAVPLLASVLVGGALLWRRALRFGEWVEVGGRRGEVAGIGLLELVLVPEEGGAVSVPTLSLLWRPVHRLPAPRGWLALVVDATRPVRAQVDALRTLASGIAPDVQVTVEGLAEDAATLRVSWQGADPRTRSAILLAVSEAGRDGAVRLARPAG
ncbi:MAG: mechanosensitive ion channel family protein [Deltaproteobacteria bacterium]|nr:mechanosensitive ion channel family protein [Deltaproteobacteria bacterium]